MKTIGLVKNNIFNSIKNVRNDMKNVKSVSNNCFIKFIETLCIYFVIRVNQTDLLFNIFNKNYYKGTLIYTYYDCLFPYEISSLLIMLSLLWFVYKSPECNPRWYDFIVGMGVGICSFLGISFREDLTWNYLVSLKKESVIYIAGTVIAIVILKGYMRLLIEVLSDMGGDGKQEPCWYDKVIHLSDSSQKNIFLVVFGIWMIWLAFRYPGGINYDEYKQINALRNHVVMSQHWPILTTFYYGGLVLLGGLFNSPNIGLFTAIIGQMIYGSLAVIRANVVLKKSDVKSVYRTVMILLVALNPIIARYATTAAKDTLYAFSLLWICILIADVILNNNYTKKAFIEIVVNSIIMCVTRRNGTITIILVAGMILVLFIKKGLSIGGRKVVILMALLMLMGVFANAVVENVMESRGHKKGSIGEGLSVPLQQTARLSRDYPEIVTEEDKVIIDKVISFEEIGQLYYPKTSDAVKDTYYGKNTGDLVNYIKVWTKYLFKAPSIYIQAFFHMNGDFLDVNVHYIELNKLDPEYTKDFEPYNIEQKFRVFTDFYEGFPLIWPICNVGIQSWLAIYLMLMAIDKRDKGRFIVSLFGVVNMLICLLGPTFENNGIRYLIPTIVANQFVFMLFMPREDIK